LLDCRLAYTCTPAQPHTHTAILLHSALRPDCRQRPWVAYNLHCNAGTKDTPAPDWHQLATHSIVVSPNRPSTP